jgi:modulator of FtsH protease
MRLEIFVIWPYISVTQATLRTIMASEKDSYTLNGFGQSAGVLDTIRRNSVLRNTYILLAISLIPTVIGAWLGVQLKIMSGMGAGMTAIIFLAGAFGLMFAIEKFKTSAIGVGLLLLFTFFMGVMLSRMLGAVLSFSNGPQLVMMAFGGTAAIFGVMSTIATVSKRDFSGMSKWLMIGALVILVAGIANIWLQLPALSLTVSAMAMFIFSAWMLTDVQRVVNGGETNYVSATLSIYMNLYNVFSSLLSILGITSGDRD